jgi:hypothetical protein
MCSDSRDEIDIDNEHKQQSDWHRYIAPEDIDPMGIFTSLTKLRLLCDDMYLRSQAHNLCIVDTFITDLEYKVLQELQDTERTPSSTYFLSAQSQMWIFAAYELLRTWRQRAKDIVRWHESGGLEHKLAALKEKNNGYMHFGREVRIKQIEAIIGNSDLVSQIKKQLLHLHIPFTRLEYIRVSIAKHEVSGSTKSAAKTPGYGRINSWCGSLDYELENDRYIMGYISRRDIADSIRHLDVSQEPPTTESLKEFDDFMSGKDWPA